MPQAIVGLTHAGDVNGTWNYASLITSATTNWINRTINEQRVLQLEQPNTSNTMIPATPWPIDWAVAVTVLSVFFTDVQECGHP